ncbi:MAG: hypothetical protein ACK5NK_06055 [Niabella sp.]
MKTKALLLAVSLFVFSGIIHAQKSKRSVESRVEFVMKKMDALNLNKDTYSNVSNIFTDFYKAQDKIRDNIQGPATTLGQGFVPQDYQSVRKQNEKIIEDREKKLKKALTAEQYKKWTTEIEPSLHSKK